MFNCYDRIADNLLTNTHKCAICTRVFPCELIRVYTQKGAEAPFLL